MLNALIFDFDGVILDTETVEYEWWKMIYADHGADLPFDVYLTCVGAERGTVDFYQYLGQVTGRDVSKEAIKAAYKPRLREMCDALTVLPGVMSLIDQAYANDIPVAIASSSPHEWVDRHLARLGIAERFTAVCCFGDVDEAKPSPKVYRFCLQRLSVEPAAAVAIEDSHNGVTAAKAADLFTLAVPNPVTEVMDFSHADRQLESLAGIELGMLERWKQ